MSLMNNTLNSKSTFGRFYITGLLELPQNLEFTF